MATQVKHRRGTSAEIAAGVPAVAEFWYNTTDNTIHTGNGFTPGGIKQGNLLSVKNFGAVGDGVTDDTAAFKAAIASVFVTKLWIPEGDFRVTDELDVLGTCTGFTGAGEIDSRIIKEFNGNLIKSSNQGSTFSDFWVVGNAATYSGGGFYMVADDCNLQRVRVTDTTDACVIFKANDSTYNTVTDCFLLAANNGYAIRSDGTDLSTGPTVRTFTRLKGGGPLVNFAGMNRAILTDSFGTLIGFDGSSSKIGVHNNRFTNANANLSVDGFNHIFTGNQFGFSAGFNLKFEATCEAVSYDASNQISIDSGTNNTCIDNKSVGNVSNTNAIYQPLVAYPFILGGTTTDSSNGNAPTATATYSRNGRTVTCSFSFIKGSTTTTATGAWILHLPYKSLSTCAGVVRLKSSSGTWYDLTFRVFGGSNEAFISFPPGANMTEASVAWGLNSQLDASITYVLG